MLYILNSFKYQNSILLNMPKNSVKQIEKDQRKILDELTKNANKSINDIAETCGFSRQKVWRVINNLEKNHTIWGYSAVTDEEKLDKKGYIILIKRSNKPLTKEIINHIIKSEMEDSLKKMGVENIDSYYTHGTYDWIIHFNASDIRVAKAFIEEFNKSYGEYFSEIKLLEKMFTAKRSGTTNPEIILTKLTILKNIN